MKITGAEADGNAKQLDGRNKGLIFTNYAPFTDCISGINSNQIDRARDLDAMIPMYSSIEYSKNYSKTSGIL